MTQDGCAVASALGARPASKSGRLRQGTGGPFGRQPPPQRANVDYPLYLGQA